MKASWSTEERNLRSTRRSSASFLNAPTLDGVYAGAVAAMHDALGVERVALVLADGTPGALKGIDSAHFAESIASKDAVTVPIQFADEMLGHLVFFPVEPGSVSDVDLDIADNIATEVALAILRKKDDEAAAARARLQTAIADFGLGAISTPNVRDLKDRATRLIVDILGVEETVIWDLLPDDVVRVAACVMLHGEPGVAMRVPPRSQLAATLASGQPTVVEDWSRERRYKEEAPRVGREIRSTINLIIPGVSRPYGVITVSAMRPRSYTPDEIHWLQSVASILATRIERQEAVDTLANNELRYRSVAMATAQLVWVTDPEGSVIGRTEAWVELTGQTAEQAAGDGWMAAIHEDERARVREAWRKALDQRTVFQEETQIRVRDGMYRYSLIRTAPVLDPDGTLIEWIGTLTDIHERRRADDAVKLLSDAGRSISSSLDYQATIRAIAESFVPRFADWCFIDAVTEDGSVERLARHTSDPKKMAIAQEAYEKYGAKNSEDFIRSVSRVRQPILIPIITDEMVRATAVDAQHLEYILQIPPRSCIALPLRVRDRVFGVMTFVQSESYRRFDDHDLAFAEELSRRAATAIENSMLYEQAQAANRAKDEFLATLSHELRTPMTAILGWTCFLQLGEKEIDHPALIAALRSIERSAHLQSRIIEDLLDISRIVTGKMELDVRYVDLERVIGAAIDTLRPAAQAKKIAIQFEFSGEAAPLLGDPNRLQQVCWNLIANAIKFTPSGGSVRVALEFVDDQATISVTDSGEGIAPDFLPHVFERFRQADSSTTRQHGGMGLGLAIVKHLVELHGGTVEARSEGKTMGSRFVVTLPQEPASALFENAPIELPPLAAPRSLGGLRVLIVEDDPETRNFLEAVLLDGGAEVRSCPSVSDAMAAYREWSPDVVVSDIAMPGEDGYDLVAKLRIAGSSVPVIAVTAHAGADRDHALAAGFQRYLAKPFDPVHLVRLVGEVTAELAG